MATPTTSTPADEERRARQRAAALVKAQRASAAAREKRRCQERRRIASEARRRLRTLRATAERLEARYEALEDLGTDEAVVLAGRLASTLAAARSLEAELD